MVGQLLEVILLLMNLLAKLEELLLLTLADGVVLVSLLSALEGVSITKDVWISPLCLLLLRDGANDDASVVEEVGEEKNGCRWSKQGAHLQLPLYTAPLMRAIN